MQRSQRSTEVLVIGGGPAGLLLASKLGVRLNVGLLDRNRIGQTSKFWLTTDQRLTQHGLQQAGQYRTTRATLGTFQGSLSYAEGQFTVVNDAVLLSLLIDRCRLASVRLTENTKLLSIARESHRVVAHTTDGPYNARLILDASGGSSPFAATFRLHRLHGFYSIYGAHLENLNLHTADVIGAHVVHFGHPAPLFEIFPTGPTSAFCVVFVVAKHVVEPQTLKSTFDEHVAHNPFFTVTEATRVVDLKLGVVPIGRSVHRAIPGILPVGEAGMLQSPLLGAAFNEVLVHADRIVNTVVDAFERQQQGTVSPRITYPIAKVLNDSLQGLLVRPLLDGELASFERVVQFIKDLGPERAYRLFGTQLEWRDAPAVLKASARYFSRQ